MAKDIWQEQEGNQGLATEKAKRPANGNDRLESDRKVCEGCDDAKSK